MVPQNPVHRNPATAGGFANLQAARDHLLDRWLSAHPGDRTLSGFFDLPLSVRHPSRLPFRAPHFVNHLDAQPLPKKRRIIHTTLDLHQQQTVEALVHSHIARHASEGIQNAAVVVLNRRSMAVKAMVGSANFFDAALSGQVNGNLKPAKFYGLALCLGGVEVTMLELASLYAALPNGGALQPIRMLASALRMRRRPNAS